MTGTATIDRLIINSPYEEPKEHWKYDYGTKTFSRVTGRRDPGYFVSVKTQGGTGQFIPLELVKKIRHRVKAWRVGGYKGVTGVTKRLLEHWNDPREREGRKLFFCQLEAMETLIWLTESHESERTGIAIESDGGPFTRLLSKMATGSGKTIVMAMLIAWQVINKVSYPQDTRFSKNILVVAPGLTVKSRLQVLMPHTKGNFYDEFSVVPTDLAEKLNQGRMIVRNWHALDWDTDEDIRKKHGVDKRGAKSDEAYVRDVLAGMSNARNIVVINDEAHHAWRVGAEDIDLDVSPDEVKEATKWVGGLDRIDRARNILCCYDFSATPFVPSGKQATEEMLFRWIVSDFGLNDAIESGLVKTPRIVIRDDSIPAKDLRSRLYHLYMDADVQDDLNRKAGPAEELPDLVLKAYTLLGSDWLEWFNKWREAGRETPPVMITVANRTETAARIKYAFEKKRIMIDELCVPAHILHIDSKVLEKAESLDAAAADEMEGTSEEDSGETQKATTMTRQQYAEALRRTVDTVGKKGELGEQIRNVVSVGMLSEGWDARTVTHIMGLRAFTSQLLCEQVVGRGLRRTSYEVNRETGLFEPEYVNVFGIPFEFLPHESTDSGISGPEADRTRIEPDPKKRQYEITWPNIIRVAHELTPELNVDWEKVRMLQIDAAQTPTDAQMAAVLEGKPDLNHVSDIDLVRIEKEFRLQKIVFETARRLYEQMGPSWKGNREYLLAQLVRLAEEFISSEKLLISSLFHSDDAARRRVFIALNIQKIMQHIWEAIRFQNTESFVPVFDPEKPLRSTMDMRSWYTTKQTQYVERSHINFGVYDSTWEATEGFTLDMHRDVEAWARNDHLGFDILYHYKGAVKKYRPDFLVRLKNGVHLILEVKGEEDDEDRTKAEFLGEWITAVNKNGGFGKWTHAVSRHPSDIGAIIHKVASQT